MINLPKDFWTTGPLCQAHGGTSSIGECKACKMSLPLRSGSLLAIGVWVPFQVDSPAGKNKRKVSDLPRFVSVEEVKDFIQYNNQALANRLVNWEEYTDLWAAEEYAQGVGRSANWQYGPPLAPDADPINPQLYEQVKKLSS